MRPIRWPSDIALMVVFFVILSIPVTHSTQGTFFKELAGSFAGAFAGFMGAMVTASLRTLDDSDKTWLRNERVAKITYYTALFMGWNMNLSGSSGSSFAVELQTGLILGVIVGILAGLIFT